MKAAAITEWFRAVRYEHLEVSYKYIAAGSRKSRRRPGGDDLQQQWEQLHRVTFSVTFVCKRLLEVLAALKMPSLSKILCVVHRYDINEIF